MRHNEIQCNDKQQVITIDQSNCVKFRRTAHKTSHLCTHLSWALNYICNYRAQPTNPDQENVLYNRPDYDDQNFDVE